MSNKRKLNKLKPPWGDLGGPSTDEEPFGGWTPKVHLDSEHPTCGECGRELHDYQGVVEGFMSYKCTCGFFSYCMLAFEKAY